jgi:hypothetical protein
MNIHTNSWVSQATTFVFQLESKICCLNMYLWLALLISTTLHFHFT